MKKIFLTSFLLLLFSTPILSQEIDILTFADKNKRVAFVEDSRGRKHKPKYGDPYLEEAEKKLKKYPRPWTIPKVIQWYAATKIMKERLLWLRVLGASTDSRAALVLGKALDESGSICSTASECLQDYFIKTVTYFDTESAIISAQKWWAENKARLKTEAEKKP